MYPQNQPQQQDLVSKLFANKKLAALIIGGVIVLLITMFALLANSGGSSTSSQVAATGGHLSGFAKLVDAQSNDLRNGDLRDQNANLAILAAGAGNDIVTLVASVYGVTEPDEEALAANASRLAAITVAVESAINTNNVDEVYQAEIIAELEIIDARLASLAAETGGSVGQVLVDVRERLNGAREGLAEVVL